MLPKGSMMFTMDATSMYTNIDTPHGLDTLAKFIEMFKAQLPAGFPTALLLMAVRIIM